MPLVGPEPEIPVSLSTLNPKIAEWKMNAFADKWEKISTAKQTRNFITNKTRQIFSLTDKKEHQETNGCCPMRQMLRQRKTGGTLHQSQRS